MKVIFLDFDGVLNSAASFLYEKRRKCNNIANTLSVINTSNFQYILDKDSDIKVVISSTWRKLHTMEELRHILDAYGVRAKIIGKTPVSFSGHRGQEIRAWLEENSDAVTKYVIIDDDPQAGTALLLEKGTDERGHFFQTTWEDGLSIKQAAQIAALFRGDKSKEVKI